jgi:hypothetical protein
MFFFHHVLFLIFFLILHLLFAITIVIACYVMSFHASCCNYLAWYIIPCLALMLLGVVRHPRLALLLLVMVHHYSPCIATTCGALLVPYTIIVVCYGSLSITLHYFFVVLHPLPCANATCCGVSSFALHCYHLLWCVVPHFTLLFIVVHHPHLALLLFFTGVCRPSPCSIAPCCGASPSPYVVATPCGSSFFTLRCYFLIPCLFQVFTSLCCCCCLLWFVIPCLVLLLTLVY